MTKMTGTVVICSAYKMVGKENLDAKVHRNLWHSV